VVAGDLDSEWDLLVACARAFDNSCADRSESWPPPIMTPLATSAASSVLRRFYPFLSHNLLRLATSPGWYLGDGAVARAFIGLAGSQTSMSSGPADPWSGSPEVF
jgi:hypothetical protein